MKERTEKAKGLLLSKACERCGRPKATYIEDPHDAEMFDNHSKHWLCSGCFEELTMRIRP